MSRRASISVGLDATDIGPAECAERMRAIPPGAHDAAQRALTVVVETLLSLGYGDGVEALETLLTFHKAAEPPPADPLGTQAAQAAVAVQTAIEKPEA